MLRVGWVEGSAAMETRLLMGVGRRNRRPGGVDGGVTGGRQEAVPRFDAGF